MTTTYEDILNLFREIAEDRKATERQLKAMAEETERRFQETERQFRETDKKIAEVNKAIGRLGNRLGEFIEESVRPAALRLFQERGIAVNQVQQRVNIKKANDGVEIDLMVANGQTVIGIECKSELSLDDVNDHIERLGKLKQLSDDYAHKRILGAVAAMVIPENVAKYAYRKGLFVIAPNGENLDILNNEQFVPQEW
ncbi:DUF3782 domain-containing protein [Rhodopseudomonas palustris]|uniref:DUF3782 domain-containing protein n=1 Tax=Thiospirillum jenense TaxID=1653858 RepID=A0A839HHM6_9GAMM|nr:DUF3782 domain-containing protein [Thiospirillum jenense]MBB1091973.1 DUF3782 domain-containing protein [Rhodopseudomonas palustris]MBB1126309.1 DUF3782 domain-containing protein [Thiospirillum jenense]